MKNRKPSAGVRRDAIKRLVKRATDGAGVRAAVSRICERLDSSATHKALSKSTYFRNQLEEYLRIHMSDCPFEVRLTTQYSPKPQACVKACRRIKKGSVIKYLTEILFSLTKAEEERLQSQDNDFSIVSFSYMKRTLLYLDPERLVNHNCSSNTKFKPTS